nr:O-antigen ligase family protein [Vagococcus allomyrinae]
MFVTQTEYIYILENRFHPLRLGFVENRLFGIFSDPNFAATICLVTVAVSLYYLFQKKEQKRLALNIFFVINIIFQLAFVVLSGSRTGLLELYVVLLFATFMYTYQFNFKQNKKMYQKLMISILASGIMFLSAFVSLKIIREVFITVPSYIVESVTTIENDGNSSKIKKNRISKKIDLSRADVENSEDVSNGRVNIWKTGIKLFNEQKIIGVGPSREGIVAFAEDKFPDSVIAKTGLSLHSFLVQTLTGTGILGFIVFFSFFILNMLKIFLHSFKDRKFVYSIDFVFYLITLLISINAVVSSEIVLVNKIGAFIFWLLLGRVLQAVINDKAENY